MKDVVPPSRKLRAFLCHSSGDQAAARDLYQRLSADGADPWLDAEKLLPGQDWELEIRKAVKEADVIIVCLSEGAINKRGFVQKEIKYALDVADEQPEGAIFLIPLRFEECDIPNRLRSKQWVAYFHADGYFRLTKALGSRARELGIEAPGTASGSQTQVSTRVPERPPEKLGSEGPVSGRAARVSFQESEEVVASRQASGAGREGTSHGQSTSLISRARRLAVRLRSTPTLIALLVLGLLLILGVFFTRQWMRKGQETQRPTYEQESPQVNQNIESVPPAPHPDLPSSNGPSQAPRPGRAPEIGLTLYPGSVRADGEMAAVTIYAGVKLLRLHLLLFADKYQSYSGELWAAGGERAPVVLADLQVSTQDGHESVAVMIPTQGLASGDHLIKLSGRTADGVTQEIAMYHFLVVHK